MLIMSLVGSVFAARLFYNSGNIQFFFGVLAGIFSPLIIIAAYRFLKFI